MNNFSKNFITAIIMAAYFLWVVPMLFNFVNPWIAIGAFYFGLVYVINKFSNSQNNKK